MKHISELLGPVGFVPQVTFSAVVNGKKNTYLQGRAYTIRPVAMYQDLYDQAQQWATEGKIVFGAASTSFSAKAATMKTGG